jgi:hypothetical protein
MIRWSPLRQFEHLSLSFSILTFLALNDVAPPQKTTIRINND